MILRAIWILFALLALTACSPQAMLLSSLIPEGTTSVLLSHLDRVSDKNQRRIVELEQAQKWDELAKFADENIAKDRSSADWWFVAGYARMRQRQLTEAADAFSRAVGLEPDNMAAWNFLAQTYRAAGEPRRAVNALNNALNITRDSPATLYLLGASYSDLGRQNDAVSAYREAVALQPDFALAWFALAQTYSDLGRRDEAQAARSRLEKLDPKLAAALK